MKKLRQFILREEPFGFTLFQRNLLQHKFVSKKDIERTLKELNIRKEDYNYLPVRRKDFRRDIIYSPIRIYYELTLACNLHCKFCFNSSGNPRNDELSTKEVIESLHGLQKANVIDVRFTGGELTERSDWFEILKTAKQLGFVVSCNTHGAYSDSSISKKFARLNLDQVTISIDGKKEHHEKNRGIGTFDRTIYNLKEMYKLGVKLRINTLLTKYSMNDLEFVAKLASEYTEEINFFPARFIGRGANLRADYSISWKEFYRLSRKAKRVRKKYPKLNLLTFAQVTKNTSVDHLKSKKFELKLGIPDGTTRFNITSDGKLWAGGYIPYINPKLSLGNIKNDDVFEIWQKSKKLEKMRGEAKDLKLFCNKCPEFEKRCPGPVFEIELFRKLHPGTKNLYCIHSDGSSLLLKMRDRKPIQCKKRMLN